MHCGRAVDPTMFQSFRTIVRTSATNGENREKCSALLDHLAKGFAQSGYNMQWLHRTILNSDAYQRSWRPNDTNRHDERNFSRMTIRRLPAEVVADAITQATASKSRVDVMTASSKARTIGPDTSFE